MMSKVYQFKQEKLAQSGSQRPLKKVSPQRKAGSAESAQPHELKELVQALSADNSRPKFKRVMAQALLKLGISHFSISELSKSDEVETRYTTFPCALNRKLRRLQLSRCGVALDYIAAGNTAPIFLSSIAKYIKCAPFTTRSLQRNRQAIELYERFGFNDLYFMSAPITQGGKWLFMLGALDVDQLGFHRTIQDQQFMLQKVVEAAASARRVDSMPIALDENNDLNPDMDSGMITLLNLLARKGASLESAASMMGITCGKASRYFMAAKIALEAKSPAQVIYKAMGAGLIQE